MNHVKKGLKNIKQPLLVTLLLMLLCGLIFPLLLTGLSQLFFPYQAGGSIVERNGVKLGSAYVGQQFTKPYFMKGRPSAVQYNTYTEDENGKKILPDGSEFGGVSSGSDNYAPSNPALKERVENDIEAFLKQNPGVKREEIPADLLTASGSGLDPHISPDSAKLQIAAISAASGISTERLMEIVEQNTQRKFLGIFGEERVNVLGVNLDIAEEMGLIQ